jgi:hypothetical protein
MLPLFGTLPFPCAAATASSELELATPEYSKTANRIVPGFVSETVTWFAPPTMFSA